MFTKEQYKFLSYPLLTVVATWLGLDAQGIAYFITKHMGYDLLINLVVITVISIVLYLLTSVGLLKLQKSKGMYQYMILHNILAVVISMWSIFVVVAWVNVI